MTPCNLLVIMDDEHNKKVTGYNGHPVVRTPNLDRLAAAGTRFDNAYSSSPICVPARAASRAPTASGNRHQRIRNSAEAPTAMSGG